MAQIVFALSRTKTFYLCNDYYVSLVAEPGKPLSDWKRLLRGSMSGATVVTHLPLLISHKHVFQVMQNLMEFEIV